MIQKINYADKQTGGKFSASDVNEIKSTVNSNADVLSENSQSILSLQGGSLGSIKPTDAAPTPARNGNYTFSIGGDKPAWLTAEAGVTEVKAGDGVAVVYTAPSSYTYTHVDVSSDFITIQELNEINKRLAVNLNQKIDCILLEYWQNNSGKIGSGSYTTLNRFVKLEVKQGEEIIIKTQGQASGHPYFIADSSDNILVDSGENNVFSTFDVTIPANAAYLYVNCKNGFARKF